MELLFESDLLFTVLEDAAAPRTLHEEKICWLTASLLAERGATLIHANNVWYKGGWGIVSLSGAFIVTSPFLPCAAASNEGSERGVVCRGGWCLHGDTLRKVAGRSIACQFIITSGGSSLATLGGGEMIDTREETSIY